LKVLISSSKNEHLLAPQYAKELCHLGVDICETFYIDDVFQSIRRNIISRILFKLFPYFFYKKANQRLIDDFESYKPDRVCIFKGMEIFPETLNYLKTKGCILINYNLDHPFNYITKASGNLNVLNSIPIYDIHITYSNTIKSQFNERYSEKPMYVLPFGYHSYVKDLVFNQKEIIAVCFIGYADKERATTIQKLVNSKIEVHLYGKYWKKYFKPSQFIHIFEPVFGVEYWLTLNKYRVQLNLLRSHNENSHNMRSFEIPASSALMLTKNTQEHKLFFTDNLSYFSYSNDEELIKKAKFLINLSKTAANKFRIQAKKSSKKYSYSQRAKEFKKILESDIYVQ
jgi:spore maturation protein CgeB